MTVPSDAIDQDEIFLVVTPFTFTRGGSARCHGIPRIHSAAVSQSSLQPCTNPRRDGFTTPLAAGPSQRVCSASGTRNSWRRREGAGRLARPRRVRWLLALARSPAAYRRFKGPVAAGQFSGAALVIGGRSRRRDLATERGDRRRRVLAGCWINFSRSSITSNL